MPMFGSILNAVGIVLGGILALAMGRSFSGDKQFVLRKWLAILTVFAGLQLTWAGLNGTVLEIAKQGFIMMLALTLGRLAGRLFRIQRIFNRMGQYAGERITAAQEGKADRLNDGFLVCSLLFCAGPLGPVGAIQDGLTGHWQALGIKTVMDGLATMGFVGIFGWSVLLAAIPVLAFQGSITQLVHLLEPTLRAHNLVDSISAVSGILVFCVALILFELKKVQLADYLPSLVMAPLITWLWS